MEYIITRFVLIAIILCSIQLNYSQEVIPKLRQDDRIRIAEAYELNNKYADKLWENWSKVLFPVLLVYHENEMLINHPKPTDDFTLIGYDSLLKGNIYYRPRQYQENLLATFPAVNGIATVVIGTPEMTNKSSTAWVITLLHEHFHQLQMSYNDYNTAVNSLNLSKGDESGMWMLNYNFPYDSLPVNNAFNELSTNLLEAINSVDNEDFFTKAAGYYTKRKNFTSILNQDDYNYLSFQLWQEGVARYTEMKIARLAGEENTQGINIQSLTDYISYKDIAQNLISGLVKNLKELTLTSYKRVAFYSLGAGEALLLDKLNPNWKQMYLTNKFYLENYFKQ